MKCFFVFGTRLNLSGNDFFKNKCDHRWKSGQRWKKNLWMGATFLKRPPTNLWYRALWSVGQKRKKGKKKFFFVFLMINLNKLYFLVGHNYWKKIKKSDYQKCNHACIMHVLTAHHSKAHRGIDFEQLVTEEEVRLVKAWKFH